ncbi:MAG: DUF4168 domain-containing protein, partial [Bacteroidota bacterium]
MTSFTKYFATLVMVVALIGCQNDGSDDTTAQQSPDQQTEQQQQPDQMGQMQQQEAPDVDVSDEEAATFAEAAMSAQEIQMEAQKKMIGVIEDEGLDVETYQKIAQSQQMGGQQGGEGGSGDFSDEDMEKYESATAAMEEMQSDIQDEVSAAIEDAGMEMDRFQDISRAAQQDSALQTQ